MVVTNNDITQKTYKKLSIQVSLDGLSFCVFDLLSNTIINTMSITFEKTKVIEEQLWRTFVDYPILTKSFDEVMVIHDGTNVFMTEYSTIYTGSNPLITLDADINGGNVRLLTTPAMNNTAIRTARFDTLV